MGVGRVSEKVRYTHPPIIKHVFSVSEGGGDERA